MWGAVPDLLATVFQWGSPPGVTEQSKQVHRLWDVTYYIAIPIGAIVMGLIVWCAVRYREHKGRGAHPAPDPVPPPAGGAVHDRAR